jgi:hypothetical protein
MAKLSIVLFDTPDGVQYMVERAELAEKAGFTLAEKLCMSILGGLRQYAREYKPPPPEQPPEAVERLTEGNVITPPNDYWKKGRKK